MQTEITVNPINTIHQRESQQQPITEIERYMLIEQRFRGTICCLGCIVIVLIVLNILLYIKK